MKFAPRCNPNGHSMSILFTETVLAILMCGKGFPQSYSAQ